MEQRQKTSMNDACPCGSGLKYKKCCLDKDKSQVGEDRKLVMTLTAAAVLVGLAFWYSSTNESRLRSRPAPVQTPAAASQQQTPAPWYYDSRSNRHWDPRPGHNHWHNGPPPSNPQALSSTATTTTGLPPGETPAPWFYDAANNRHWNPEPGHNHWHTGPPPKQ